MDEIRPPCVLFVDRAGDVGIGGICSSCAVFRDLGGTGGATIGKYSLFGACSTLPDSTLAGSGGDPPGDCVGDRVRDVPPGVCDRGVGTERGCSDRVRDSAGSGSLALRSALIDRSFTAVVSGATGALSWGSRV